MSSKSKKTSRKRKALTKAELERPIDPKLWEQAKHIAGTYQFIVQYEPEEPYFYAFGVEAKGAMGGGKTIEACYADIIESMAFWVVGMLEEGIDPPQPAANRTRSAQVNIRVSEREKTILEEAARRAGFRGLSDFMRTAALDKAG